MFLPSKSMGKVPPVAIFPLGDLSPEISIPIHEIALNKSLNYLQLPSPKFVKNQERLPLLICVPRQIEEVWSKWYVLISIIQQFCLTTWLNFIGSVVHIEGYFWKFTCLLYGQIKVKTLFAKWDFSLQ